jgi:hypothetical protein
VPTPSNPHVPRSGAGPGKSAERTAALFVRLPTEHARRLDRAAFELRVPKQSLVSELVERYVDPDSPASLMALGRGWGLSADGSPRGAQSAPHRAASAPRGAASAPHRGSHDAAPAPARSAAEGSRRRVTVETLDPGELTVGHHSFRPRNLEVLNPEEAAELLQVDVEVVLELARAGELPGRELCAEWRFARVALLQWLGAGSVDGTADRAAKG